MRLSPPSWQASYFKLLASTALVYLLLGGALPKAHAQQENFRTWSVRDGLPKPGVYALHEDSRGYLWIGTEGGGVARFDGQQFTIWDEADGLGGSQVRCMAEDGKGRMLFGLENGVLSRYDGSKWQTWQDAGQGAEIRSLAVMGKQVFIATLGEGIQVLEGGRIQSWTPGSLASLPHANVRSLVVGGADSLWIGTDQGLALWHGDSLRIYGLLDGVLPRPILSLFQARNGDLWAGTERGALRYRQGSFYLYTPSDGLVHPRVRSLSEDNRGRIWMGTQAGASRFDDVGQDGVRFETFTEDNGLSYNRIRALLCDAEGNIWFGTFFGGICRFSDRAFQHFGVSEGLGNPVVQALAQNGEKLATGTWAGLQFWQNGAFSAVIDTLSGLPDNSVHGLAPAQGKEAWWVLCDAPGLVLWSAGKVRRFGQEQGLTAERMEQAVLDATGQLWLRNEKGQVYFGDESGFQRFDGTQAVSVLATHPEKGVWAGTKTGVVWHFTPDQNAEATGALNMAPVTALVQGPGALLWAGSTRGRIAVWHRGNWEQVDVGAAGKHQDIGNLVLDGAGSLWATLDRGALRFRLDAEGMPYDQQSYDFDQGFRGVSSLPGAVLRDATGRIWFGCLNGLTAFDPAEERPNDTPARIRFTGLNLFQGSTDWLSRGDSVDPWSRMPRNLVLPSDDNNLTFHFSGIALETPEAVRYRWRLEGIDRDWVEGGTRREAAYAHLPAGHYTFRVAASNADGRWVGEPAAFPFRIQRPWWAHPAAVLFWFVVALAVFALFVRLRTATLHRRAQQLQSEVDAKTMELRLSLEKEEAAHARAEEARDHAEIARIRAERSEKVKEEFLANMSHEIRTPMNAIVGMTELLLRKQPEERQLNYLQAIRRSSDNLLVILNDILDLSKIEAGKMTFEQVDFSLSDAMQAVLDTFGFKAEEKSLQLRATHDPDCPAWLKGDPVRFSQVLLNLVGNALKFTHDGSVTVHASVEQAGDPTHLRVAVSDTGIGIPSEKLETIFINFTQASDDTTRHYGGTGLGLSISKRLVQLQGGTIGVESTEGEGSTFWFVLPFAVGQAPATSDSTDSDQALGAVRLLLMEDDAFNQMVAVDTLAELAPDATVDVVGDGQAGLEALEAQTYDAVLMDLGMPILDGYETARRIRSHQDTRVKQTPLMAMTASVTKAEVDRCFEAGMDDYIAKPFDGDDLIAKIAALLQGRNKDLSKDSPHP